MVNVSARASGEDILQDLGELVKVSVGMEVTGQIFYASRHWSNFLGK